MSPLKDIVFTPSTNSGNPSPSTSLFLSTVPLKKFMELGIPVTINSDNMTVSNTDVPEEMKHMVDTFQLKKEDIKKLLLTSIEFAFIKEKEKEQLRKKLDLKIDEFYERLLKR